MVTWIPSYQVEVPVVLTQDSIAGLKSVDLESLPQSVLLNVPFFSTAGVSLVYREVRLAVGKDSGNFCAQQVMSPGLFPEYKA